MNNGLKPQKNRLEKEKQQILINQRSTLARSKETKQLPGNDYQNQNKYSFMFSAIYDCYRRLSHEFKEDQYKKLKFEVVIHIKNLGKTEFVKFEMYLPFSLLISFFQLTIVGVCFIDFDVQYNDHFYEGWVGWLALFIFIGEFIYYINGLSNKHKKST